MRSKIVHVFAVCVDLSTRQRVKLWAFYLNFKPSHWMLTTAGKNLGSSGSSAKLSARQSSTFLRGEKDNVSSSI